MCFSMVSVCRWTVMSILFFSLANWVFGLFARRLLLWLCTALVRLWRHLCGCQNTRPPKRSRSAYDPLTLDVCIATVLFWTVFIHVHIVHFISLEVCELDLLPSKAAVLLKAFDETSRHCEANDTKKQNSSELLERLRLRIFWTRRPYTLS